MSETALVTVPSQISNMNDKQLKSLRALQREYNMTMLQSQSIETLRSVLANPLIILVLGIASSEYLSRHKYIPSHAAGALNTALGTACIVNALGPEGVKAATEAIGSIMSSVTKGIGGIASIF